MLAINLSEMWPCIFGSYTNIIAAQILLQCVSIKPSSQIKVTFSFQFQNYLFSTKLSIAEFYEINGFLLLSWTQNIFFYTYFIQFSVSIDKDVLSTENMDHGQKSKVIRIKFFEHMGHATDV